MYKHLGKSGKYQLNKKEIIQKIVSRNNYVWLFDLMEMRLLSAV